MMETQSPTIYVVDDDPSIRTVLTLTLRQEGMCVQEFVSAEAFLTALSGSPEDNGNDVVAANSCAIIDVCMPGMDGLKLQEKICERGILLPLIFLSGQGNIPMSVSAIKAGAEDFLTKPVSREKLMACVTSALNKSVGWHQQNKQQEKVKKRFTALTPREMEILAMTMEGLPNKLIARHLDISLRTVEHHKTNILNKTGAATSLELSRLVQESGMSFS